MQEGDDVRVVKDVGAATKHLYRLLHALRS